MRSLDAPFRNLLYAYNISSSLKDYQISMKQLHGAKKASLLMTSAVLEVQPMYVCRLEGPTNNIKPKFHRLYTSTSYDFAIPVTVSVAPGTIS
jgi:hypothetical protein